MKRKLLILSLSLVLALSGCGALVDLDTPKSDELKQEYSYYEKSVANIRSTMKVSPEESDEIFLVLLDCGVNSEINSVQENKTSDGTVTYDVWSSGIKYTVTLSNNAVESVTTPHLLSTTQLYPAVETSAAVVADDSTVSDTTAETVGDSSDVLTYATDCVEKIFGKDNVIAVEYFEDTTFLSIEARGSENLTDKMTLRGMYMNIETLLKDFSDLQDININFDILYPFVDKKGNSTDALAIRARYDWNDRKDINWDNFLTPNIPDVSTTWAVHPAFENIVIE